MEARIHNHSPLPTTEEPPLRLPNPLREYQWTGIRFLTERASALLADEMGLGKTVQVSVALSLLFRAKEMERTLVVAPAALQLNWERELSRWGSELSVRRLQGDREDRIATYHLPIHVLVCSYDQLRMDSEILSRDLHFDVVVLDEAQRIKNVSSRTALACRILQRDRSWALTGTPIENSVADLLSIYQFVHPGLLNAAMNRTEVQDRMAPFYLRRRKAEVLGELPPIIVQDLLLELGGRQRCAYDQQWRERLSGLRSGERTSETHLFALLTRLKQLCNYDPASNESAKLEALRSIVGDGSSDGKIIVFSQYVNTLAWMVRHLAMDLPCEVYHGGLQEQERDAMLMRFRREPAPRILLMSLRAAGVGLNIQEATAVVLFDRWWNPALEAQAISRAHRFGRTVPLHVFRFLIKDSIEERIAQVLEDKTELFQEYIDDADVATVAPLTRGDLLGILGIQEAECTGTV